MDKAAIRSRDRVKANARASAARLEDMLLGAAKKLGHRGVADFQIAAREFFGATITERYARDLLIRAGFANPKP